MDFDNIPDELFDFIVSKTYEELSEQEKQTVDTSIGSEEYKAFRAVIIDFKKEDKHIEQQIPLSNFPKKKTSVLTRILYYRIPVYQVAAAFAILLGSALLWKNGANDTSKSKTNTEIVESGKTLNKDHYPDDLVFNL